MPSHSRELGIDAPAAGVAGRFVAAVRTLPVAADLVVGAASAAAALLGRGTALPRVRAANTVAAVARAARLPGRTDRLVHAGAVAADVVRTRVPVVRKTWKALVLRQMLTGAARRHAAVRRAELAVIALLGAAAHALGPVAMIPGRTPVLVVAQTPAAVRPARARLARSAGRLATGIDDRTVPRRPGSCRMRFTTTQLDCSTDSGQPDHQSRHDKACGTAEHKPRFDYEWARSI